MDNELLAVGVGSGEEGAPSAAGAAAWEEPVPLTVPVSPEDHASRMVLIELMYQDLFVQAREDPEKAIAIEGYLSDVWASVGCVPQHYVAGYDASEESGTGAGAGAGTGTGHYGGGLGSPAHGSTLGSWAATAGVAPVGGLPASSDRCERTCGGGFAHGASATATAASNFHRARGGSAGQEGDDDADDVDMGASSSGGSGVDEPQALRVLTPLSPPNAGPMTPVAHVRAPRASSSQAVCSACNRPPKDNKPMCCRYNSRQPVCEACRCSFRYYAGNLGITSPDHKKLRKSDMEAIRHLYSIMDAGSVGKGGRRGGHGRAGTRRPRAATNGLNMGPTSCPHAPSNGMVVGPTSAGLRQAPPAVRIAIELQPRTEADGLTPVMLPSCDGSGGRARMVDAGAYNVNVIPSPAARQPAATWAVACYITAGGAGSSSRQGSCPRWLALCNPSQVPGDDEVERRLNAPESAIVRELALPFQASTSAAAGRRATFSRLVLQPGTQYKISVLCAPYAKCKHARSLGCPQLQRYWVQRPIMVAREHPAAQRPASGNVEPVASSPTVPTTAAAASATSHLVSSSDSEHDAAAAT